MSKLTNEQKAAIYLSLEGKKTTEVQIKRWIRDGHQYLLFEGIEVPLYYNPQTINTKTGKYGDFTISMELVEYLSDLYLTYRYYPPGSDWEYLSIQEPYTQWNKTNPDEVWMFLSNPPQPSTEKKYRVHFTVTVDRDQYPDAEAVRRAVESGVWIGKRHNVRAEEC